MSAQDPSHTWPAEPPEVEKGAALLPGLGPLPGDDGVARVLKAIPAALGVPAASPIFSVVGHYPAFLVEVWRRTAPVLVTEWFEAAADAVRGELPVAIMPGRTALSTLEDDDRDRLRAYVDTQHWLLPKLLLIATGWHRALAGHAAAALAESSDPAVSSAVHPDAIAIDGAAPPELETVFRGLTAAHRHPRVLSPYRVLGMWPEVLALMWSHTEAMANTAPHLRARQRLLATAAEHAHMVGGVSLDDALALGLSGQQVDDLRALLALFRYRLIPPLLVDIAVVKALIDGPASVTTAALRTRGAA